MVGEGVGIMKALDYHMQPIYKDYKICLRCGHINVGARKICDCKNPILITQKEAWGKSINELRRERRIND